MSKLTNKAHQPLTNRQVQIIEYIYKIKWQEYGTIGGAKLWFDVIMDFLEKEGYVIEEKKGPPK